MSTEPTFNERHDGMGYPGDKDHDWENLIARSNADLAKDYELQVSNSDWRKEFEDACRYDEMLSWLIFVGVAVLIGLVAWLAPTKAPARITDENRAWIAQLPDDTKKWYKGVKSKSGVPCCDQADGHKTNFSVDANGIYWVPIAGDWLPVPPEAVIYNSGNPEDMAIVWYVRQNDKKTYFIRCFVPVGDA